MIKSKFKVLFHFENKQIEIVEIKRNGVISEDVAQVYHWLLYDKLNDMLSLLVFKTMKSEPNKEYRTFEDASLVFDSQQAQFIEKGKTQNLRVLNPETALSATLREAIEDYLLSLRLTI